MLAWMTATAYLTGVLTAVGMILEKVHGPVVDAVRQFQPGQFVRQRRMPDRIKRLREIRRMDVDKIAVYQHGVYGM